MPRPKGDASSIFASQKRGFVRACGEFGMVTPDGNPGAQYLRSAVPSSRYYPHLPTHFRRHSRLELRPER